MPAKRAVDHDAIKAAHDYGLLPENREIFLTGCLDEEGEQGIQFLKNFRILLAKGTAPIVVHMHSLGGDWSCGIMIRDIIAASPVPVVLICHGIVASMGTVIAMGCLGGRHLRVNAPSCDWMIHDGVTGISPLLTYKAAQSTAGWEKRIWGEMVEGYVAAMRTGEYLEGATETKIKSFLRKQLNAKDDWWLSSEEANYYGFVDGVLGNKKFKTINDILSGLK